MAPPKIVSRAGRKLSLVLRHKPEDIGLTLDRHGWARVDELLRCLKKHKLGITREDLNDIVATNNKQRFRFSDDGLRIRANQGHSIDIDLELQPQEPPKLLYHGTARRFLPSIGREGLKPGSRQHVHLSADRETATAVGKRHGKLVILRVDAARLHTDGYKLYRSDNGVWLTDKVPVGYFKQE